MSSQKSPNSQPTPAGTAGQPAARGAPRAPPVPGSQGPQVAAPGTAGHLQQQVSAMLSEVQPRPPRDQNAVHTPVVRGPSLHVGNLPTNTFYDLDLKKLFEKNGFNPKTYRVVGDPKSGGNGSLGYGYVQFSTADEMNRCLKQMNNIEVHGKEIVLSVQQDKRDLDPAANLFVRNLDRTVTQQQLFKTFSEFGLIHSAFLKTLPDGTSAGFAFVQFDKSADAQRAIASMHDKEVAGKKIEVMIHQRKDQREATAQNFIFTNLFVKGLPAGSDDAKLAQMFSSFGKIQNCKVSRDRTSNELLDYGYVNFENHQDAAAAIEAMNKKDVGAQQPLQVMQHVPHRNQQLSGAQSHQLDSRTLQIKKANDSKIFVNFLPLDVTEETLKAECEKVGPVISLSLRKLNNKTFQQGLVLFESVGEAQRAIQMMHDSTTFGSKPLVVDFWLTRDEIDKERKNKNENDLERMLRNLFAYQ